jgi:hypothetical protein
LFKIAHNNLSASFAHPELSSLGEDMRLLGQFCISEAWTADLNHGAIYLGTHAASHHGILQGECGLLTLMRCYAPYDRARILELFERAATGTSSFCYATTIPASRGVSQPVFCIGESNGFNDKQSGAMAGMFFFPLFRVTDDAVAN